MRGERVYLESEEYGREYFDPGDGDRAGLLAQLRRVLADAREHATDDGVLRRVGIEIDPEQA